MGNNPKLTAKEHISLDGEGESVDAYVGPSALRQCGGVYVISRRDGLVKVGITEGDFARRFKEVEQASRSAGIVGIRPEILVPMDEGMANVESAAHKKLSANREGGEWFRATAEEAVKAVVFAAFRQRCRNAMGRKVIELGEIDKPQLTDVELRLLDRVDGKIANCFGVAYAARRVLNSVDNNRSRVDILCRIVSALALELKHAPPVRAAFNAALDIVAENITDPRDRAWALCGLAQVATESMDGRIMGQGLFADALSVAERITGGIEHDSALVHIAHTQAKVGDFPAALSTVQNMDGDISWALSLIASARPNAEDIESMLSIARGINDEKCASVLNSVVGGLLKSEMFDAALSVAQEINDGFYRSSALVDIMSARAKAGDIDEAISMIPGIGSNSPHHLAKIAVVQMKAGKTKEARNTFSAALSAVHSGNDWSPAEGKKYGFTRAQVEDMNRSRADVQKSYLKDIALAQAEAGDITSALSTAQSIDDAKVRDEALRNIASALAKSGNVSGALDAARSIDRASPFGWRVLRGIILAQAKSGDIDGAFTTARSIIDHEIPYARALETITSAQAEAGDIDGAFTTARSIYHEGFYASALEIIASAQAEAGNFQAAIKTALGIASPYLRASALTDIAKHMAAQESEKP